MKTDVVVSTASSSRFQGIFPKLGSPTVNATKLGADPAFAVSEIVVATNASTKMTSQISMCFMCVDSSSCYIQKKRYVKGRLDDFRSITACSQELCLVLRQKGMIQAT